MKRRESTVRLRQLAAFCAAHFVGAMLIAVVAFGFDMDQLRSRSHASRIAAEIHDVLWFPHDSTLRSIPNDWLVRNTWVIPLALVVNSLVWGVAMYALWRMMVRGRAEQGSRRG